jgi:transmembrane sensor
MRQMHRIFFIQDQEKMSMNEQDFKALLKRYEDNTCTPAEREILEKWLDALDSKQDEFATASHEQKEDIRTRMRHNILYKTDLLQKQGPWARPWRKTWIRVAASLMILSGVSVWVLKMSTSLDTSNLPALSTTGKVHKTILPDGNIVWLKGASRLIYPSTFTGKDREVTLEGQAFFEISKDPSRPFLIHCGTLTTKVLGTSFNINNVGAHTEVVVFTGKVTLSSAHSNDTVLLTANDQAVYTETEKSFVVKENINSTSEQKTAYLQGTDYDMNFDDKAMEVVLKRIEQKFNVVVKVDNTKLLQCRVTADLTDQSLDDTMGILKQTFGGEYEINGNEVNIKGSTCI